MRRCVTVLSLLVLASSLAHPASAATPGRTVVVTIPGTTMSDWLSADAPSLQQLLGEAATGLLSARTAARAPLAAKSEHRRPMSAAECMRRERAGMRTMLDGVRSDGRERGPYAVEAAARAAGVAFAERSFTAPDRSAPGGVRIDYAHLAQSFERGLPQGILVLPLDDALRADCLVSESARERWVDRALSRADRVVSLLRRHLAAADTLIVASTVAPWLRERGRNVLTIAAVLGPGFASGAALTSASTRRGGIVALIDLAPTILTTRGLGERAGTGRVVEGHGSATRLRTTERRLSHVAEIRLPLLRGFVWTTVALLVFALLLVLAGRGRATGRRAPRTTRDALAMLLLTASAMPVALLLEPLFDTEATVVAAIVVVGLAAVLAAAATALSTPRNAYSVVAGVTLAVGTADLAAGGALAARSAISYTLAEGARFYGIGNEMMGVLVVAALLWGASALESRERTLPPAAAILAALVVLMGLPTVGAKFGSAFVTTPAFGIFVALAAGRRADRVTLLAIAIATTFAAASFAAFDVSLSDDASSHVARIATAGDEDVLTRKVAAALRLLGGSYWTAGIFVSVLASGLLLWRRRVLLERALWGKPHLRAALVAALAAAITSVAFNDAGIVAAAMVCLTGASTLFQMLLAGNAQAPRSEAAERLKEFVR